MRNGMLEKLLLLFSAASFALCGTSAGQSPPAGFPTVPSDINFASETGAQSATSVAAPRVAPLVINQPRQTPALQPPGTASIAELPFNQQSATETLAAENTITVPVEPQAANVRVEANLGKVTIFARDADVRLALAHLSEEAGVNIVIGPGVSATINTSLTGVTLQQALDAILKINGLVWTELDGIVYVTQPTAIGGENGGGQALSRGLRGQRLEVFDLNFVPALEVLPIVRTLLSPSGTANTHTVDQASTRQTRERVVVEDFDDRLNVIREYLATVDNAPRQVLIEAHVLQVTLDDDQRHGVNLLGLARLSGARLEVRSQGFADASASPGFMMGVDGTDLDGMIELLQSSSYVRTLAAPKVMVVNGQEARIQIGSKFGYFETTTTQTGTFQNVNFLDIGVVLQVTPTITDSGQVMLAVQPKVSGGRVNPETGLPEEETTEAATTVILSDGKGMILGGLIKEEDDHKKSWVPWIGEKPIIGKLFSRENEDKQRVEVIIAVTPHIVPFAGCINTRDVNAYRQAADAHGILSGGADYAPAIELSPFYENQAGSPESEPIEPLGLIETYPSR